MPNTYLLLPTSIDAIFLDMPRVVCGPEVDFSLLPYYDDKKGIDVNSDRPYLAESVVAEPFNNENFTLFPGVHLHWALPQVLQRTKPGGPDNAFPAVPTRWYVRREIGTSPAKEWIIESDYIWQDEEARGKLLSSVSVPLAPDSDVKPYRYMGRQLALDEWKRDSTQAGESFKKLHKGEALTALGWGSPSFDVFYPNCHSVFGLYDDEITSLTDDIVYTVLGWYEDPADEFIRTLKLYPDIQELERDISLSKDEILAQTLAILQKRLQWSAVPNDIFERQLICFGVFNLTNDTPALPEAATAANAQISAAHTQFEALSALLAVRGSAVDQNKAVLEDQLEAVLFGDQLNSYSIDTGAQFRELRHEKGFQAVDAGWLWDIHLVGASSDQPSDEGSSDLEKVPIDQQLLRDLQNTQLRYNQASEELESLRAMLYDDWCRYLVAAYPPMEEIEEYPSADVVMALIRSSLTQIEQLALETGRLSLPPKQNQGDRYQAYTVDDSETTLAAKVQKQYNSVFQQLQEVNKKLQPSEKYWELQPVAAPRYYVPNAPSIIVSIPHQNGWTPLQVSDRFGEADIPDSRGDSPTIGGVQASNPFGEGKSTLTYTCILLDDGDTLREHFNINPFLEKIAAGCPQTGSDTAPGYDYSGGRVWHTFRVEWEAELYSAGKKHNITSDDASLSSDFIDANYNMEENDMDFQHQQGMDLVEVGNIFTGMAYVSSNIKRQYRKVLEGFLDNHPDNPDSPVDSFRNQIEAAKDELDSLDLLGFTLSGINASLLQSEASIRFQPRDPLGFSEYKQFANDVAKTLTESIGFSPRPLSAFYPVRSGALQITKLRLVDTFGRTWDITPDHVITCEPFRVPDFSRRIKMPPRFSQPARLNFRWLDASALPQGAHETSSHLDTGPICGWLLPNMVEQSLMVFDATGRNLGSLDQNGKWESAVVGPQIVESDIRNTENNPKELNMHLQRVLTWLLDAPQAQHEAREPRFLESFLGNLQQAQDNIHPEERAYQNALSLLVGKPIAVARVSVNLELKGFPASNKSWYDFQRDLEGNDRNTAAFAKVKFPYRIGEYRQLSDGLIGYWCETATGLKDTFAVNDAILALLSPDYEDKLPADFATADLKEFLNNSPDNQVRRLDLVLRFANGAEIWDALTNSGCLDPEPRHPKIEHYSQAEPLTQSVDDPPSFFTLLLDPLAKVHLSSGIFPVKEIDIPDQYYKAALKNMEITFLAAPVLFPRRIIQLSLPAEQGWQWSWVEKQRDRVSGKTETIVTYERPFVRKQRLVEELKKTPGLTEMGDPIWQALLTVGWLRPVGEDPESAFIDKQSIDSVALPGEYKLQASAIKTFLKACAEEIVSMSNTASLSETAQIHEGWLRLKQE